MLEADAIVARTLLEKAEQVGLHGISVDIQQRRLLQNGNLQTDKRVSASGKGKPDQLEALIASLSEEEKQINLNIDVSPAVGDDCPTLDLIKTSDGSSFSFSGDDGKVYLLDFWATWCGPCQGPMQHNQSMLESNPNWEGKASIIAISMDDSAEMAQTRMTEKGWNKILSYWASDGFDSRAARLFNIQGIPFCVLVHKKQILWTGHPSDIDLQKAINDLISGEGLKLPPGPPKEGDACPDIECLDIRTEESTVLQFKAEDPTAYLIDFWATWCGPCQKPMQHNQDMLSEHPEWEGKVKIIGISLDRNKQDLQNRISDKGWDKVTHYWTGPQAFKAPGPSAFEVKGIPHCLLVHKGTILWLGHPMSRKLDQDFNSLINGGGLASNEGGGDEMMSEEQFIHKVDQIKAIHEVFIQENPSVSFPVFVCFPTRKVKRGAEDTESYRLILGGEYIESKKGIIQPIIDRVKELFPALNTSIEYIPAQPGISRAEKCSLCPKSLSKEDVQFVCVFCSPAHTHCEECQNKEREGTGSAKLAHPHSLYKITPESTNLEEPLFGLRNLEINAVIDQDPANITHHGVGCDNRELDKCDGTVNGIRWKCAHCPDYDYCEKCEKVWGPGASEEMKKLAKQKGHEVSHILIAIPFP